MLFTLSICLTPIFALEDEKIYDSLDDITEPGQYQVRIYFKDNDGNQHSDIVTITLEDDDIQLIQNPEVINKPDNPTDTELKNETQEIQGKTEIIVASNFGISRGTFNRLTNKRLIELAHAKAWIKETGETVPITSIIKEYKSGNEETYTVTFTTKNNTSIRIEVFETNPQVSEWVPVTEIPDNESDDAPFSSITLTSITVSVVILLIIPIIVMSLVYLYTQKQAQNVDKLLYHDSDEQKQSK